MLAERFHMDQGFFEELNRGKVLDQAGTAILVANVNLKPAGLGAKAARLEADKQNNTVRVLAKDGALLAVYPASIGSEEKPAPSGTLKVVRVARNPTYTYDPEFKFRGVKADAKVHIAAGPNNPVGAVWIALDQKSYGIHGTAEPSKVGKVDSHGCVRMTNWDALALAKIVRKGMPEKLLSLNDADLATIDLLRIFFDRGILRELVDTVEFPCATRNLERVVEVLCDVRMVLQIETGRLAHAFVHIAPGQLQKAAAAKTKAIAARRRSIAHAVGVDEVAQLLRVACERRGSVEGRKTFMPYFSEALRRVIHILDCDLESTGLMRGLRQEMRNFP